MIKFKLSKIAIFVSSLVVPSGGLCVDAARAGDGGFHTSGTDSSLYAAIGASPPGRVHRRWTTSADGEAAEHYPRRVILKFRLLAPK
jgi:hypothetical protein